MNKALKDYQEKAIVLRDQIENLDKNKPMMFGLKEWEEKRVDLVKEHRKIKHLYDHDKLEKRKQLVFDQRFGRDASIAYTEKHHPDLTGKYKQAQEFLTALEQLKQQQKQQEREKVKEKQQNQDNDRDYGMRM